MIIRVQSSTGTHRVEVSDRSSLYDVFTAVSQHLNLTEEFSLTRDGRELKPKRDENITALKFRNGEMLRLSLRGAAEAAAAAQAQAQSLVMDEVDIALSKKTGRIPRKRDPQMCRHGAHDKCINCTDIDPFDMEMVEKELGRPIKFLSFHAYLQKLNSGGDKGKLTRLEPLQCTIKPCDLHPPYPEGICTKCQPSAICLSRPTFRMVDYVEFESQEIPNQFIQAWRDSGAQRFGYMYGRYLEYDFVPLGIKAEVSWIYEPKQMGGPDEIQLLEDPHLEAVDKVACALGLQKVGMIFTDIVQDPVAGVICTRYANSEPTTPMFSAQEIMMAATQQLKHKNVVPFKYNPDCVYGSKFATVIIHGDGSGGIHLSAYQATPETMSMVDADILRPAKEPGLMAVLESSKEKYVPEVFYFETDKHKNQIKQAARPTMPVEFLHVDLASGSQAESTKRFLNGPRVPFPKENRDALGQSQSLAALGAHFAQDGTFLEKLSDVNLLVYLATSPETSCVHDEMPALLRAVAARDVKAAAECQASNGWKTLQLLMQHSQPSSSKGASASASSAASGRKPISSSTASSARAASAQAASAAPGSSASSSARSKASAAGPWACSVCTFINENPNRTLCEVCGSPKS